MVQEVATLAAAGRFDHVIIEGSGISEPLPVAAAFAVRLPSGGTLSDVATLDTLVWLSPAASLAFFRRTSHLCLDCISQPLLLRFNICLRACGHAATLCT